MVGQEQEQKRMTEHDRRSIIIVCKDEKYWIDPGDWRSL